MPVRSAWSSRLRYFVPAAPDKRSYVLISLVSAVGNGLFVTGTAVFALRIAGLTAAQVGLCYSIAGVVGLLASGTLGSTVGRFGARRAMLLTALLEGLVYLGFCAVHSFALFTLLASLSAALSFGNGIAVSTYVASITGDDRVQLRAQSRAMMNVGFGAGASLAALVLVIGTRWVFFMLPLGDAVSFFAAAAALALSLPADRRAPVARGGPDRGGLPARRNLPFLLLTLLNAVLRTHESLLLLVVPLWIVARTSTPKFLIGLLLVLNTVACVLLQVRASRGTESLAGSVRKARWAAVAMFPGCVLFAFSGGVPQVLAVVLMLAGCAFLTGGELLQCAGEWGLLYALALRRPRLTTSVRSG